MRRDRQLYERRDSVFASISRSEFAPRSMATLKDGVVEKGFASEAHALESRLSAESAVGEFAVAEERRPQEAGAFLELYPLAVHGGAEDGPVE